MPSQGEVLLTCQNSDEDIKNVVVIGQTGSGKSSLLNTLSGQKETFIVSASGQSVTSETVAKLINWRNSQKKVNSIDTPGLADSLGRDSIHIVQMVAQLKKQKKVDAFFIVLNGKQTRFDLNIKAMLKLFRDIFGADFINNTAIVLTNWEQSERAKDERQDNGVSEEKKCQEINLELKEMGFEPLQELQCFFVDNQINTMSQERIIKLGAQKELELLDQEVEKLGGFVQSQKPFICQDIKECLTQNDKLKKQIEEEKEEKEQLQREMEEYQIQALQDKEEQEQKHQEELQKLKIQKDKEILKQYQKLQNEIQQNQIQNDQHQKCKQNLEKKFQEEIQKFQEEQQKSELLNQEKIRIIEEEKEKIKNLNEEEMVQKKLEYDKLIKQIKEDQENMQNNLLEEKNKQISQMQALIQKEQQQKLDLQNLQNQYADIEKKRKKQYQKHVQEILDRPPAAGKAIFIIFRAMCRDTFLRYGKLDIEKYNGKYAMTEFDQDETSIKKLEGVQVEWENQKYQVAYHGMVNEFNEPHGWGRAIYGDEIGFVDGQWLKGQLHGIVQYVGPREGYERAFYKYGHLEKSEVKRNW